MRQSSSGEYRIAGSLYALAALSWAALMASGCSPTVRDQVLPFTPDAVKEAKALLGNYAAGQPVGSESEGFDTLVQRVKDADQAKAAELREFLDDAIAKGVVNRAKAKELLERW
jgi:hypothetical protein